MARPRKGWRTLDEVVVPIEKIVFTVTPPTPSCASCIYRRHNGAYDECRRYPAKVTVSPDNWCGEFKA